MTAQDVRRAPIAGQWYPGGARQLAVAVGRYMEEAEAEAVDRRVQAPEAHRAAAARNGPTARPGRLVSARGLYHALPRRHVPGNISK